STFADGVGAGGKLRATSFMRSGGGGGTADGVTIPELAVEIVSGGRGFWITVGAAAFRAGSRIVPHIPQNRKLLELTSPHFGQITWASPTSVFLECNSEDAMMLKDALAHRGVVLAQPPRT